MLYRSFNHFYPLVSHLYAHNLNVQQLFISSLFTVIPDTFMASVSAHGRLVYVFPSVASVSDDGVY